MRQIIGIMGMPGSGKDTCGNYFIENGFHKISFASKVKDVAHLVLGWDRKLLEGDTHYSREWREKVDEFWGMTPRQALQKIGTEMFRAHIHPDVWVKSVYLELIQNPTINYVITDCRFENEIRMIIELGGRILHVQRGPEPKWASIARSESYNPDSHIHITDWNSIALTKFASRTIENNGSLEDLYAGLDIEISKI